MITAWVLHVCIGVSWAGCGSRMMYEYPTEESCYRALRELRTGDQPTAESSKKRNSVAVCYPKNQPEPKL